MKRVIVQMNVALIISSILLLKSISLYSEDTTAHYDEKYWAWQKIIGETGGILNKFKFEEYIKPTDTVIDFGCGGGFLLNQLQCARKIGAEVNTTAIKQAQEYGIETYSDLNAIDDNIADVIISNHALEHVPSPYDIITLLKRKLKKDGLLIIVVPSEQACNASYGFKEEDRNQHLFTWTPMTLGNLIKLAGFAIIKSEAIQHCWVGDYINEAKNDDLTDYHERCHQHAIKTNSYQIRVVAKKL